MRRQGWAGFLAVGLVIASVSGCSEEAGATATVSGEDTSGIEDEDTGQTPPDSSPDSAGTDAGQDAGDGSDGAEDTNGGDADPRVGEDVPKLPCEAPADDLCPCSENSECGSGDCFYGRDQKVCVPVLVCPDDFHTVPDDAGGGDVLFRCISDFVLLCQPCTADTDCGGNSAACLDHGDSGHFCGTACGDGVGDCPSGYGCTAGQCQPDSGECACNAYGVDFELKTTCAATSSAGQCSGTRQCGVPGLSACSAPAPVEETCNGVDDDCDGQTDDCSDGDITTSDACVDGSCVGTPIDCSGLDDGCHLGVVDGTDGKCVAESLVDGHPCDDGDACTPFSACLLGVCTGAGFECDDEPLSIGATANHRPALLSLGDSYVAQWVGALPGHSRVRVTDSSGSRLNEELAVATQATGYAIRTPLTPLPNGGFVALHLGTFPTSASTCYPGACPYNSWAYSTIPLHATLFDPDGVASAPKTIASVYGACHSGVGSATCNGPTLNGASATLLRFADGTFGLVSTWHDNAVHPITFLPLDAELLPGAPVTLTADADDATGNAAVLIPDGTDRVLLAWMGDGGKQLWARVFLQSGQPEGEAFSVATSADPKGLSAIRAVAFPNGRLLFGWQAAGADTALFARRFDSDKTPLGDVIALNQATKPDLRLGDLAPFSDYGFVAVWDDPTVGGGGPSVHARRFLANGQPAADAAVFETGTSGAEASPSVAVLEGDQWVLAWYEAGVVRTQRFEHDGSPVAGSIERPAHAEGVGDQHAPAVAVAADGTTVLAFQTPVFPGKATEIALSILGPDAEWRVRGIAVNTTTADAQTRPAVAAAGDRIVVAWDSEGQDGSIDGIYARTFGITGDGTPVSGEIAVNQTTAGSQAQPAVAMTATGGFLAVWTADAAGGSDIFARGFDSAGVAVAVETRVNAVTDLAQDRPAVAVVPGKAEYVVVWQSKGSDGDGAGIAIRRLDAAGLPLSDEMQANTTTAGDQREPAVGLSSTGRSAVCWVTGGADSDVRCQLLKPDFAAFGDELVPHAPSAGAQAAPSVSWLPGNDLLVAWETVGVDGDGKAVELARFSAEGAPIASRVVVNRHWAGDQRKPSLAARPAGDVLVGWESDNQDAEGLGVYVRVIPAP